MGTAVDQFGRGISILEHLPGHLYHDVEARVPRPKYRDVHHVELHLRLAHEPVRVPRNAHNHAMDRHRVGHGCGHHDGAGLRQDVRNEEPGLCGFTAQSFLSL